MKNKIYTITVLSKDIIEKFNEQENALGLTIKPDDFWIGKTEKQLDMYEQTLAFAMSNLTKKA